MNVKAVEKAMQKQGLNLHSLAVKAGIEYSVVFKLVRYGREPKLKTFKAICIALDLDPAKVW